MALSTVSLRVDVTDNATPQLVKIATGLGTFQQKATSVLTSSGQLAGAGQGFSGALAGFNTQLNTVGTSAQTLGQRLGTLGSAIAQQGTSFGVASASVIGVASSFLSLEKASVRAEASQVRVRTLTTTLAAQTEKLRIAREKGNLTDGQMAVLESRIADTQDKLGVAQERATVMQNDYNETLSSFVTQLGPQVIAAGGSIAQIFAKDPQGISGFTRLKTAISGLISPLSGLGSGAFKVQDSLKGLAINLEGSGGAATGFGSALSGIGGKLSGLVGTITPIAAVLAAGVGAWLLYQHTMEQVANFKKDFAIISSLDTVQARLEQNKKAFDDLKDEDPFSQESLKKTAQTPTPENIAPLVDPFAGLSNLVIKGKNAIVGLFEDSNAQKIKAGSIDANLTAAEKKLSDALIEQKQAHSGAYDVDVKAADQKAIDAQADVNRLKALKASVGGQKDYANAVTQSLGPVDAFTRGALGLGNQLVSNISIEDQLFAAREKGMALNEEDSKNYAEASQKKQAADKLFALGQINAQEATKLTREELLLIDQAYTGTAATSAVAIEKLSTTTVGLRGSVGQAVSAFLDAKIAAVDYSAALTNVDLKHRLVQQGTLAGLQAAEQFFQGLVKDTAQEQALSQALDEGAAKLGIHGSLMGVTSSKAKELLTAVYQLNTGFLDQSIAAAKAATGLNDVKVQTALVKSGQLEGIQTANALYDTTLKSVATNQSYRQTLIDIATNQLHMKDAANLTTEELNNQIKAAAGDAEAFNALDQNMQSLLSKRFDLADIFKIKGIDDQKNKFLKQFVNMLPNNVKKDVKLDINLGMKSQALTSAVEVEISDAMGQVKAKDAIKVGETIIKQITKAFPKGHIPEGFQSLIADIKTALGSKDIPNALSDVMNKYDFTGTTPHVKTDFIDMGTEAGTAGGIAAATAFRDAVDKNVFPQKGTKLGPLVGEHGGFATDEEFKKNKGGDGGKSGGALWDAIAGGGAGGGGKPQKATLDITEATANITRLMGNFQGWLKLSMTKAVAQLDIVTATSSITRLIGNFAGWVGQAATPSVVQLDITAATGNITRLIGNFGGWLSAAQTISEAQLAIDVATANITRLIGNFAGWLNQAKTVANINANPAPATSAITKAIGNFNGWFSRVNSANPPIKANPVPATQSITKVISNFQGWLNKINSANPAIKANNTDAMNKINAVKNALNGLKDKSITVNVGLSGPGAKFVHSKGGVEFATKQTMVSFGEEGPEIAAFFPLRFPGQQSKGSYDINIPTPVIDAKNIRDTVSGRFGSVSSKSGGGSSTVHVHLNSPIYLFPGGPQLGKLIRQYVFDEVSKYAQV